jgi:hypothetical protein
VLSGAEGREEEGEGQMLEMMFWSPPLPHRKEQGGGAQLYVPMRRSTGGEHATCDS